MANARTGVRYIGNQADFRDDIYGTGLTWRSGETLSVPVETATDLLKHRDIFAEVPGFFYPGATTNNLGIVGSRLASGVRPLRNVGSPERITLPSGLADSFNVSLYRNPDGVIRSTFDWRDYKPAAYDATYIVKKTGSNSNNGTSESSAVAEVDYAESLIAAAAGTNFRLIIYSGLYTRNQGPNGVQIGNKNIVIEGQGDVILSAEYEAQSWTNSGNGAWFANRTSTGVQFDKVNLDSRGRYSPLLLTTSHAMAVELPGTYYADGTGITVHRIDGLMPTVENHLLGTSTTNMRPGYGTTICRNMRFRGGADAASTNMLTYTGSRVIYEHCAAEYTKTNGFDFNGAAEGYVVDSEINYCLNDGANAQIGAANATVAKLFLERVTVRDSGFDRFAAANIADNNGFSTHDGGKLVAAGCLVENTFGPCINNVGTGTNVALYQCAARNPVGGVGDTAAVFGVGAGTTTHLEECESLGGKESAFDLYVAANGAATVKGCYGFSRIGGPGAVSVA